MFAALTGRKSAAPAAAAEAPAAAAQQAGAQHGQPLELVRFNATTKKFEVGKEALAVLQSVRAPVGVVSVCGRARQGKSFILNQLLGQSSGFVVAPTHRPCTKGLWMWSAPVERVHPDGSKHYLVRYVLCFTLPSHAWMRCTRQRASVRYLTAVERGVTSPTVVDVKICSALHARTVCVGSLSYVLAVATVHSLFSPCRGGGYLRCHSAFVSAGRLRLLQWRVTHRLNDLQVMLDTEGIDAWDQTGQYSVQIFSLAVLLSSLFVYNQMGGIDEAALDKLSLVTEMTKHIRVRATPGAFSDSHPVPPLQSLR